MGVEKGLAKGSGFNRRASHKEKKNKDGDVLRCVTMGITLLLVFFLLSNIVNLGFTVAFEMQSNDIFGHPRAAPTLNITVVIVGIITAVAGAVYLCRRTTWSFFMFMLLTGLLASYCISSMVILGLTLSHKLPDCPHATHHFYHHSWHKGWTHQCVHFSQGMLYLGLGSIAMEVMGVISLMLTFALTIKLYFSDLTDYDGYLSLDTGDGTELVSPQKERPGKRAPSTKGQTAAI